MNSARMAAASDDAMLSTDLADYLTRQGVPFRESHHLVGRAVRRAEKLGVPLRDLDPAEYQAIHPAFTEDVYAVLLSALGGGTGYGRGHGTGRDTCPDPMCPKAF